MAQEILTQERLQELLYYSVISGKFYWRKSGRGRKKNLSAGWAATGTYRYAQIFIKDKTYLAHQLAHLYIAGYFTEFMDHINHDGESNGWINLRPATQSENLRNCNLSIKNKSGVPGVRYLAHKKAWIANITFNKKSIHLYHGDDFFEAVCRRLSANIKYNYHPNHGRNFNGK